MFLVQPYRADSVPIVPLTPVTLHCREAVTQYFCMEEVEDDINDILEDGRPYTLDQCVRNTIFRPKYKYEYIWVDIFW